MTRSPIFVLLALALASALAGCNTGSNHSGNSDSSRVTTTATSPQPRPAEQLAAAPTDCEGPAPSKPVAFGDYGNLLGSAPVWAGLYAAFDRSHQRYRVEHGAPRTKYGWRIKVLWVVGPTLKSPARVRGGEIASGRSLWFEIEDQSARPTTSATLNPATAGVPPSASGYKEFPSYVYIPNAGCYLLEATWPGGRWRLVFGLGR